MRTENLKRLWVAGLIFQFCFSSLAWSEEVLAPSAGGDSERSDQADSEKTYVLQVGDRVSIKIYPDDKYIKGGEMEVSSDGNITLALVGKIRVTGKTVVVAEREIAKILDADYLVNPEVVIEVKEYKELSFVVLGQVKKPGTYQFPPGQTRVTLLQAISLAGGFSDIANVKKIKIVRQKAGASVLSANAESIIAGKDPDIELEAGDVINVSESLF